MLATTTQLNTVGHRLSEMAGIHAMTDVTGFGLLGHLAGICRGSRLGARVAFESLPVLPAALSLAQQGYTTGAAARNWASYGHDVQLPDDLAPWQQALLCDPLTSGGLLVTCAPPAVPAQPAGTGAIDVFVPLAVSDAHQAILRRDVKASIPGGETIESRYGNRFWHGHVDRSDGQPITVVVDYIAQRRVFKQQRLASSNIRAYSPSERKELALSLGPDRRVPISGPLIDRVRAELPQTDPSPLARARAIYDYVIDNMEYKKVGTGWGNGDTFWACMARYGNCTDFHALFISLARAEGIPA